MDGMKATEQSQDSQGRTTTLGDRYGKIGISAVAAAVRHKSEPRRATENRFTTLDSD